MTDRNRLLETLKARVQEKRERALAEGRTIPAREINHPLIERLKAKALAEGRELKPKPITNERIKALIEKSKNTKGKEE